jgi:hypothetical protein
MSADRFGNIDPGKDRRLTGTALRKAVYPKCCVKRNNTGGRCRNPFPSCCKHFTAEEHPQGGKAGRDQRICAGVFPANSNAIPEDHE